MVTDMQSSEELAGLTESDKSDRSDLSDWSDWSDPSAPSDWSDKPDLSDFDDDLDFQFSPAGEGQEGLYEHRRVVADSGQNPVRVDKFLMDHLRDTSRNRIQKAAEAGYIQANGRAVRSNYKVKAGDVITLMFDRP